MTGSAVLITLALFFYSLGVWAERIARYLKPWHVASFWTGFAFDVAGTWAMHRLSTGPFDLLESHTLTGQIALWLMLVHAAWATRVVRSGSEGARAGFHRYSVLVWLIWLVPYFGGMYVGMRGESDIPPTAVVPSASQVAYQRMEMIGFVHFTVNTFTDREWGYGDESPDIFKPTELNADQWASVAAEVGMKELILTAKHHDGFALWPSAYTEHSVRSSSWRDGQGDLVRELVDAAREHGLEVGLYLSPWDRNHPDYGRPEYLDYYRDQMTELLTDYGSITEVWVDGANGGTGWYGGADEERRIDRETYYDWPGTWALVKSLQPETLIFSDAGPDIRWIGNEHGYAGETNWSTIDTEGIVVGAADTEYLNSGDPEGDRWVVPLCDTSIRPGWFYHASEDDLVKTREELLEVYYRSVGRNCVLLLNVPPDTRGLLHENDVAALRDFRRILDETFDVDLAAGRPVTGASRRARGDAFSPAHLVDGDPDSYWAAEDGASESSLEIDLGGPTYFDRVMLQEPIRFGQRVAAFTVEARVDGGWESIARGTTVGYKRLLRVPGIEADRVRVTIDSALAAPALSRVGLFEASPGEGTESSADSAHPNVLFIAVDDLRPELGAYGNPHIRTPHIDRLAESGVTFLQAHVQQAVCNPSRASVMTGLRPDSLRVWDLQTDFRETVPNVVTLPQHFMQNGYHSAAIGKIYHNVIPDSLSWSEPKLHVRGYPFDPDAVYRHPDNVAIQEARKAAIIESGQSARYIDQYGEWYLKAASTEAVPGGDELYYDGVQTDVAVEKLAELSATDQPFFFAIGYYRPHLPFNAPKAYWDLYDPEAIPPAGNPIVPEDGPPMAINNMRELRGYSDFTGVPHPFDGGVSEADARRLKHGYYASVSYVDAQVGRLLDALDDLGLSDNTIVVLWGDHGWKLGEHNSWAKMTNYEIDTRAPLIVRAPGDRASGEKVERLVEFVDIYPTLSDLAGLPVPGHLQGVSLVPLMEDPARPWKSAAFSQFLREGIWIAPDGIEYMGYAVRTDRYRYVVWVNHETGELAARELYDHQSDPAENVNLATDPAYAETVAGLEVVRHAGWRAALPVQ